MHKVAVKQDRKARPQWRQEPRPLSVLRHWENVMLRYFLDVFSCKVVFWLDSIVSTKASLDWIRSRCSFPTKHVSNRFLPEQMSMKTTDVTNDVFNNFNKARVKDVLSRWNSTSKRQKSRKKKRKQFNTKWRKSCYWYWRCLQWVTDHPFTDWKWKRHNFNL